MGRPSLVSQETEKEIRDSEVSSSALPKIIEKVIVEQHKELLQQLDAKLDNIGRRVERESSILHKRSTSRLQSQSSKLSKMSRGTTGQLSISLDLVNRSSKISSPRSPASPASPVSPASPFAFRRSKSRVAKEDAGAERPQSPESPDWPMAGNEEASDLEMPEDIQRPGTNNTASQRTTRSDEGLNSYDLAHHQGSKVDLFKKQMKMSSSEVSSLQRAGWASCCSKIQRTCEMLVKSNSCELFFALMIVSNSVYLGVQLEMTARNPNMSSSQLDAFFAVNIAYAVVFSLEVLLRLIAFGIPAYFCAPGWGWNWLDVFVVASTWIELLLGLFEAEGANNMSNSNLRVFRLVKITRLVRVLRVLRVVQYVRPLRTLMHCLVDTTKSFVWAMLLLVLMMYVFGLLFTDAVVDFLRDANNPTGLSSPEQYFGTVSASMGTLFRSISGGLDWGDAAETLLPVGDLWLGVFYLYISFISFAVLNVMTGVFCHSAIKAAERDHEMVISSLLQNKKEFKELVSNLFAKIDDLGLGMITISEFEKHFNDEAVRAFFESLEMGATDAWTLFASLDADGDNVISLNDFTERCIQLHGPARSVDLYALAQQNAKLRDELRVIEELQYHLAHYVRKMNDSVEQQKEATEDLNDVGKHWLV